MILLDTNILVEYYKGNEKVRAELKQIGYATLGISVITVMELFYGARNKKELERLKKSLESLQVFHLTPTISTKALELIESYAKSHTLQIPDALIAATVLEKDMALYTLNMKDFQFIPRINLYSETS